MNIITPIAEKPAVTIALTGTEAQAFMQFLYEKEPSRGCLGDGTWLYTALYNKGYRRPGDDS